MLRFLSFIHWLFCSHKSYQQHQADLVGEYTYDYVEDLQSELEPTWADHQHAMEHLSDPYVLDCGRDFIEHCWKLER